MTEAMDIEQKRSFYRDGFVVLPGVVPPEMVAAARRRIFAGLGGGERARGDEAVFMDLLAATDIAPILDEMLGRVADVRGVQLASRFPTDPSDSVNESGYPDRDTPFFGWHGHLDGLWNGATPMHQDVEQPMTADQLAAWDEEPSRNGCRKAFPDRNANIMNFTALVGVALSDQTENGAGNVGLLKGAHHEMERFFQKQRDEGGPLGPDGPDWPRVDTDAPNGSGLRHYPEAVREAFRPHGAETADGRFWPEPTLLHLAPGDAFIVLHAVPHSATRVEGSEPRLMAYFRIVPASRPDGTRKVYPDALCDIWREWPGMAAVVAEERGGTSDSNESNKGEEP